MNERLENELKTIRFKYYEQQTKESYALMEWFLEKQDMGYKLYAATVTYLPLRDCDRDFTEAEVARFFKNLYWHNMLPKEIFKDKQWLGKPHLKLIQPYLWCFLELGESKKIYVSGKTLLREGKYIESSKLHHHAIIAVHSNHIEIMDKLIGENTLNRFNRNVMTSLIEEADIGWIGYCCKENPITDKHTLQFGTLSSIPKN